MKKVNRVGNIVHHIQETEKSPDSGNKTFYITVSDRLISFLRVLFILCMVCIVFLI